MHASDKVGDTLTIRPQRRSIKCAPGGAGYAAVRRGWYGGLADGKDALARHPERMRGIGWADVG